MAHYSQDVSDFQLARSLVGLASGTAVHAYLSRWTAAVCSKAFYRPGDIYESNVH